MIEAYYKEGITLSHIGQSLKRSRQTIYKAIAYLKAGQTAYDYYKDYKANKKRCGRRQTQLTKNEQDFIQIHIELNWSLKEIRSLVNITKVLLSLSRKAI
ncbi:hypothetical protein Sp14A_03290 [Streptococcus pluranimalium]|uniref:Uncharacterized protein n=1 Tax=Streptococcus pluranimalium TaxID=82348 RepID=A0A345VHR1_9STRE|nr:hypothetical protein Sp14A_03290 [Streptococcus pluranimalium]